jgi:multiple antibiotic resistance protein
MVDTGLFALKVFAGFFAIMNPIANLPVFISLTEKADSAARKRVAKISTRTAFIIVLCFVIAGKYIFEFFGLTIPAFKIFGGILVVTVGFEMLLSRPPSAHRQEVNFDEGISVSPLATPMLAGPGTIVTAMDFTNNADFIHLLIIIFIFGVMSVLTYLSFRSSNIVVKAVGTNKIAVIGKLMGLIIGIIGTNMLIEGISLAFKLGQ